MKFIKILSGLMVAFACGFAACFCWQFFSECGVHPQVKNKIPTFVEIQEQLVKRGYDIGSKGIDGDIGEKTLVAWDRALCDQFAAAYFDDLDESNRDQKQK